MIEKNIFSTIFICAVRRYKPKCFYNKKSEWGEKRKNNILWQKLSINILALSSSANTQAWNL